jgi:hypothetical protein
MRWKLWCIGVVLSVTMAAAQEPAGRGTASVALKDKKVTIEYGRPALKGRTFDDLAKQLPADRVWRAGSGAVTILTTDAALTISGKKIPAGKYSLYVHCPAEGDYSLLINKDLGQPLGKIWAAAPAAQAKEPYPHFEYQKEIGDQEVARIPMKKGTEAGADVFSISFKTTGAGSAALNLSWGNRSWTLDVQADK